MMNSFPKLPESPKTGEGVNMMSHQIGHELHREDGTYERSDRFQQ
jgi:hypothetical protein